MWFFVNASLLLAVAGVVLVADEIANQPLGFPVVLVYAVPFVLSWLSYWASIGAARQWGEAVRASMDMHRLELYDKVGLRRPVDFSDERDRIAPALNRALLHGKQIPDDLAATPKAVSPPLGGVDNSPAALVTALVRELANRLGPGAH
jgi:hypothetical protein